MAQWISCWPKDPFLGGSNPLRVIFCSVFFPLLTQTEGGAPLSSSSVPVGPSVSGLLVRAPLHRGPTRARAHARAHARPLLAQLFAVLVLNCNLCRFSA